MKNKRYKELIKVVKLLNSSLEFDEIKNTIIEQAKKIFNAEASSLMFLDKKNNELYFDVATGDKKDVVKEIRIPADKGIAGWIIKNKKSLIVKDVKKDERFYQEVDKKSSFDTKSIIGAPVFIEDNVVGLIEVLNKKDNTHFDDNDLELLEVFSDLASLNLKNAMWHEKALKEERYESELRVAEKIQKKIIGKHSDKIPGYDYFYKYKASKSVGGDYYDIIKYSDNKYLFAIADVTGKGVPASLVVSSLSSYLRASIHFKLSLKDCIDFLNKNICKDIELKRFITMIVGILDFEEDLFKFVNAGHLYPLILNNKNGFKEIKTNDIPLGVMNNYEYTQKEININKDDKIILFTDGLIELKNENLEMFGINNLKKELLKFYNIKNNYNTDQLFNRILNFSKGKQHDDMTFLTIEKR